MSLHNKYLQNKYYENGNHKFFQKQKKREKTWQTIIVQVLLQAAFKNMVEKTAQWGIRNNLVRIFLKFLALLVF